MKKAYSYILLLVCCSITSISFAQKDTSKRQVIDITSSYKPVLRNAVKINFSASNLNADSSHAKLYYDIPSQNLFYTYQPLTVKPLALQQDTSLDLGTRNFIKAGFGNYSTPYAAAGLSFGDGKTKLVNFYGDYISSSGPIQYQDYSQLNLKGTISYFTPKNEIYGDLHISQYNYYMYGYDHSLYQYKDKDSLQQSFSDLTAKIGFRNKTTNATGINYDPTAQLSLFSDKNKLTENTITINAPVEKVVDDVFSIKVVAKADATTYTTQNLPHNIGFNNNVFQLAPSIQINQSRFTLHGGITPTWDNSQLAILPDIYADIPVKNKIFLVQLGWVGQVIKNTYQNLSAVNPYLQVLDSELNTREVEFYGGIKATVGNHFSFSAKGGLVTYHNLPLFVNDSLDGKSFYILNAAKGNDLRVHADLSYIDQDKFTINSGLTINGYTGLQGNGHAWGMIPIEFDASLRWWAYKSVLFKGDLHAFGGAPYLLKNNVSGTSSGGTDLSAGLEFIVTKQFSAWLTINNLLDDKYQRWYNYPVYGLNFLVGATYKF